MALRRELTPPGSASYSSNTMHAGDGTWDSERDTFLLPNLMGLNFDTMRYNGMGNRFKGDHYYKQLIVAHGIFAAIAFLFLIPGAIITARFFARSVFWLRIHIGLQLLALFSITIAFVLGWCAVGSERKLTNPHHGIGLALYVMFWCQFLWGCFLHYRMKYHALVTNLLVIFSHRWFGRAVALLGLAQVPLGLCLYGSPAYLFALYTLVVFALLVLYGVLNFLEYQESALQQETPGATVVSNASAGRWRGRYVPPAQSDADSAAEPPVISEKRRPDGPSNGLLGRMFSDRRRGSQQGSYEPASALDGSERYGYSERSDRLEEGRPTIRPTGTGTTELSMDPEYNHGGSLQGTEKSAGTSVLGSGALAAVTNLMKSRRERRAQRRVDELPEDTENERLMRQDDPDAVPLREGVLHNARPQHKPNNSIGSASGANDLGPDYVEAGDSGLSGSGGPLYPPPGGIGMVANPKRRGGKTTGIDADRPEASNSRRRVSGRRDESPGSHSTGDVSLHMKIRDGDARSVTLRRLTPDEAAKSKSERQKREERVRIQRQLSRSRSRQAADRKVSGSRPEPRAPQGLNTISEVSSNANPPSVDSKDTAYLNMEAREGYEQQEMDHESKGKGKQPVRSDASLSYHDGSYASPKVEYADDYDGAARSPRRPSYAYDPEYSARNPNTYPNSTYLPQETSPQSYRPYRRRGEKPEPRDETIKVPPYPDDDAPEEAVPGRRLPVRMPRSGTPPPLSGAESEGDDNYASRRERRRVERRARERSLSTRRGEEEWQ